LSCLTIRHRSWHNIEIQCVIDCPPGEQLLSEDGRFRYLGGRVPAPNCDSGRVHQLMNDALEAIRKETGNETEGPVGFDFIESAETGDLLIVDVNARLTSSYLGYRQLATGNLLADLADRHDAVLEWKTQPVSFSVADFELSG
jgi:predicted ATP-grasp superfamily ATP-dependent carboligase